MNNYIHDAHKIKPKLRLTNSSAMAERPRELDQRFQVGVNLKLNYRLKGYFSRHCDMTQFTLKVKLHLFDLLWTCCTTFRLVDLLWICNHFQPSCTCKLKYSKVKLHLKVLDENKLCKPTNKQCSVLRILPTGVPNNTDSLLHASSFSSSVAFLVVSHRHVSFW